mmetsp:Transcript_140365/g.448641  ORF Transcript_140365/g.448641 Transcript_140365/m.448641 type:complete len:238 (-) Transcript_140365:1775-2488(-)
MVLTAAVVLVVLLLQSYNSPLPCRCKRGQGSELLPAEWPLIGHHGIRCRHASGDNTLLRRQDPAAVAQHAPQRRVRSRCVGPTAIAGKAPTVVGKSALAAAAAAAVVGAEACDDGRRGRRGARPSSGHRRQLREPIAAARGSPAAGAEPEATSPAVRHALGPLQAIQALLEVAPHVGHLGLQVPDLDVPHGHGFAELGNVHAASLGEVVAHQPPGCEVVAPVLCERTSHHVLRTIRL